MEHERSAFHVAPDLHPHVLAYAAAIGLLPDDRLFEDPDDPKMLLLVRSIPRTVEAEGLIPHLPPSGPVAASACDPRSPDSLRQPPCRVPALRVIRGGA